MQIKLIQDTAALGKFIDGVGKAGKKLDTDIHVAACSAIAHFEKHGDTGFINRLYLAMPKGSRHTALTEWFLQFGGVSANTGAGKKQNPFIKDAAKAVKTEAGMAKPWFLLKPSKAPDEVVDVLALTLKVIAKASAEGKQVVHGAMLEELKAVAEKYAQAEAADPLEGVAAE